ncbi:MAG: hypothetical protein IJZ57_01280 [Clostridia bacterium]|nr:hypothetical protein [Clostridia bacterium]
MNENLIKARELLEHSAPLGRLDCGKLCSGLCCKGDDNTGMWLFPGEEELYKNNPNFTIKETDGNFGYNMIICNGTCNRSERPLACRIYPFYPKIDGEKISVIKDLRGISSCPILKEEMKPDLKFLRNMRKATRYLIRDEETKNYILNMQQEIEDIAKLMSVFR